MKIQHRMIYIYMIEKGYSEIGKMDIIDDKKYDERDQSSKSDMDTIEKENDEGYHIDRIDNKKYYERDHILEKQANEIELEE